MKATLIATALALIAAADCEPELPDDVLAMFSGYRADIQHRLARRHAQEKTRLQKRLDRLEYNYNRYRRGLYPDDVRGLAQRNALKKKTASQRKELRARVATFDDEPFFDTRTPADGAIGADWIGKLVYVWHRYSGLDPIYTMQVSQVINDTEALVEFGGRTYLISGLDTSDIADGRFVTIPHVLAANGTRQYETVLGAIKTVLVLEACVADAE